MRYAVAGAVVTCALLGARPVLAHHGYANYDTEHRVFIEGELLEVRFANPHVIMRIRTADSTIYLCSWQSALWVRRLGVDASTFQVGDYLVIKGAPARNPAVKELASLREVRRPRDGWTWVVADY